MNPRIFCITVVCTLMNSISSHATSAQEGWLQKEPETVAQMRKSNASEARPLSLACALPEPPLPAAPPTAPPSGAYSTTISASIDNRRFFQGTLWREPCVGVSEGTTLYIRFVATTGIPSICSSNFVVLQAGTKYDNIRLLQITPRSGITTYAYEITPVSCIDVVVPITLAIDQKSSPQFDVNAAFTLVHDGNFNTVQAPVAARAPVPTAFTPAAGLWWNPNESGTGYALDFKHGVLVVTVYSYTLTGAPVWYLASGTITNNVFTASLDKYQGGQCIFCSYKAPGLNVSDGGMSITFTSNTTATMSLPGGRNFAIIPQPF